MRFLLDTNILIPLEDSNIWLQPGLANFVQLAQEHVHPLVFHPASHESAGLQAVDLFCWGIARKDGLNDQEWYAVYQDKVSFSTVYLP